MPSHCEASLPSSSSTATATISAQRNMLMINFWERPKTQQLKLPQSQHKCIMSENISSECYLKRQSLKSWKTSLNCVPKKKTKTSTNPSSTMDSRQYSIWEKSMYNCVKIVKMYLFFPQMTALQPPKIMTILNENITVYLMEMIY